MTPLISQTVRSSTSIGANYAEADEAATNKEFKYRISICCREAKETKHWIRMLSVAVDETMTDDLRLLWKEADELNRIFATVLAPWSLDLGPWTLVIAPWAFVIFNLHNYEFEDYANQKSQYRYDRIRLYGPGAFECLSKSQQFF